MKQAFRFSVLGTAWVAMVSACSPQPAAVVNASSSTAAADAPPANTRPAASVPGAPVGDGFAEPAPGIAVRAVPGTHVEHDFKRSYLTLDAWKLYPAADSIGTPLVAVVMDGSNEVTSAEMRIGRSDTAADIAACLVAPDGATGPSDTAEIGGVRFTHFTASDAAMSHYVSAESYRAVNNGACYAIDLIVAGTRPDVYDPPRTPPFTNDVAQQRLAAALAAVHWVTKG
jgi:hypothetical protein